MRTTSEPIRESVLPIETWTPLSARGAAFRYVDISSVDREEKCVTGANELAANDAPSRARQLLRSQDVLVSTVRPNLNAVAMVPEDLDGSVGSTGFTVLRADPRRLLPRYLFHWVCTPMFVADMVKKATGASYPAVSDRIVLDSEIPVPPLDEQRRIADILDKADAIRRKRKEAIALADELLRSTFLDMFGDPVANPKAWPIRGLGSLCSAVVDCPHSTPEYSDAITGVACVRSSDIQRGYFDWSDTKHVSTEEYLRRIARAEPGPGDVVYCREGARFGNAARVPVGKKLCLGQRMMMFRVNREVATPEFLWGVLCSTSMYREAVRRAGGSASPHVNVGDIKNFQAALPPIQLQRRYSTVVQRIDTMRDQSFVCLATSETLDGALHARLFGSASSVKGSSDVQGA